MSEPSKVLGSQSLVGEVTGAVGVFWVTNVWASRAMVAAKSLPILGSRAVVVLVVAEGLSA